MRSQLGGAVRRIQWLLTQQQTLTDTIAQKDVCIHRGAVVAFSYFSLIRY